MKGQNLLVFAIIVALILLGFTFSDKIGVDRSIGALVGGIIGVLLAKRQRIG